MQNNLIRLFFSVLFSVKKRRIAKVWTNKNFENLFLANN